MSRFITPFDVRLALVARREIALLDVREEDPFAQEHPLFAANLPLGRLEQEALERLPRRDVTVVVYDSGEGLAGVAAGRLEALGYGDVRQLEGGLAAWAEAGFELFRDVNSYSKAFGELVEARRHTPSLPAEAVQGLIDQRADAVILDARRFDEYRTMNIPTGVSVPGAELVLRAQALAPDPATTIIVNCAGRTRSLIGAQSLINAGVPNPVFALRNGTIGWTLAGQTLERGQARGYAEPASDVEDDARARARAVADRAGVRRLSLRELEGLQADATRTLYRFDVRPQDEFEAGHIPGFRHAPGGQLAQETDHSAPVRGARIVLADPRGVRADMTASWLAQMGWEVYVLEAPARAFSETGGVRRERPPAPQVPVLFPGALQQGLASGAFVLVDLAPSPAHRRGHIPGAWFAIRARLAQDLPQLPATGRLVFTSPDDYQARLAARDVAATLGREALVLEGGTDAWAAAGLPLETGLDRAISTLEDVYRRPYEGTDNAPAAMQAYLDWEYGLVEQLGRDGTHGFFVI